MPESLEATKLLVSLQRNDSFSGQFESSGQESGVTDRADFRESGNEFVAKHANASPPIALRRFRFGRNLEIEHFRRLDPLSSGRWLGLKSTMNAIRDDVELKQTTSTNTFSLGYSSFVIQMFPVTSSRLRTILSRMTANPVRPEFGLLLESRARWK